MSNVTDDGWNVKNLSECVCSSFQECVSKGVYPLGVREGAHCSVFPLGIAHTFHSHRFGSDVQPNFYPEIGESYETWSFVKA